jgi:hypothetical protein
VTGFVICYLSFAIFHLPFAICHLPFAICHCAPRGECVRGLSLMTGGELGDLSFVNVQLSIVI